MLNLLNWLRRVRRVVPPKIAVILTAVAFFASACGAPAPARAAKEVAIWKNLGAWSGRGNTQTESFLGLTGALRIEWRTNNEAPSKTGTFRIILQSAVSGRAIEEPVDNSGVGNGTAYIAEDPHLFYITVESANIDWSFTVQEASFGTPTERRE